MRRLFTREFLKFQMIRSKGCKVQGAKVHLLSDELANFELSRIDRLIETPGSLYNSNNFNGRERFLISNYQLSFQDLHGIYKQQYKRLIKQ
jgi:hypothetical protein